MVIDAAAIAVYRLLTEAAYDVGELRLSEMMERWRVLEALGERKHERPFGERTAGAYTLAGAVGKPCDPRRPRTAIGPVSQSQAHLHPSAYPPADARALRYAPRTAVISPPPAARSLSPVR